MSGPSDLAWRGSDAVHVIKASTVGAVGSDCPTFAWGEAHPGAAPDIAGYQPLRSSVRPFVLGVISNACDALDRGQPLADVIIAARAATARRSGLGLHDGVGNYVEHAIGTYDVVTTRRASSLGTEMFPVERSVDQHPGWTLRAWALHRDSKDRDIREVRRLRYGSARGRSEGDLAWASVAAKITVDGRREVANEPDPDPQRVIVVEVGLLDGSETVVFDGSADMAREAYTTNAKSRIGNLLSASAYRPGWNCGRCKWLRVCPALVAAPGVLGVPERSAWTRSVSATELDRYARCATAYHLMDENIPRQWDESSAQRRGRAVHRWLAAAHSRPGEPACSHADLPSPGGGVPAVDVLDATDYELAWPYLRQHVAHCALSSHDMDGLVTEGAVRLYDEHADVVVAATPDLAYVSGDGPVWREVKSTDSVPADEAEVIERFTSTALDIVMVAALAEAQSGTPAGRVEVEVLGPDSAAVFVFDVAREDVIADARRRIAALAYEWNTDTTFEPTPTRGCQWCAVRRWCDHREGSDRAPAGAPDVEIDTASAKDEEFPF